MKPSSKIKLKAPKIFAPKSSEHNSGVIQDYLETLTKFESYIINFDGFDFNKIKIKSVVNSLLRLNIGDFFKVIIQHHYRHHAQIERLLNHPQFPKD